jgi:hypothetical protein
LELRLFENAVLCSLSQIVVGMTCNCHATGFVRMLLLPVTAFRGNQIPAIGFDQFDDVAHFHTQILAHIDMFSGAPAKVVKLPFYEPEWKRK